MQISYGKRSTYDHSRLVNNPPHIDSLPYLTKTEGVKNEFNETYFAIYKKYEKKYKNTDKYMWGLVIGSFSSIALSILYVKKNFKKFVNKIFKK